MKRGQDLADRTVTHNLCSKALDEVTKWRPDARTKPPAHRPELDGQLDLLAPEDEP